MLFNSLSFLVFLGFVFLVYWQLNQRHKLQNFFVLAVSYFFYGCWDWRFLILIAASSATDFLIGFSLEKEQQQGRRKVLLSISLLANLGLLGVFKYFNFFIDSAQIILTSFGVSTSWHSLSIILPVGISFYTFQTLSYTIDVYRGKIKSTKNWLEFFAFVSFFPQLVAGPIERAAHLLPQFQKPRAFHAHNAVKGVRLILWGLFKKMVIADRLASVVDVLFADPTICNSWMALLAGTLFAYQVYCDFSGYSDIAIGSARLLGFNLMRNFKTPFLSKSMTEFWQRWHISLSSWFRDYLYIPLGGNRVSPLKWTLIILLTFTVSGLWHGADQHYVIWGFVCAIPLVIERLFKIKRIGILPTFFLFSLTLIFFRSSGLSNAAVMFERALAFDFQLPTTLSNSFPNAYDLGYTAFFLGVLILTEAILGQTDFDEALSKLKSPARWAIYYGLLTVILLFGVMSNAPQFIYFQF
ncbi:MBOAT family O-acyltransferase [Bacteroidota bacterium]